MSKPPLPSPGKPLEKTGKHLERPRATTTRYDLQKKLNIELGNKNSELTKKVSELEKTIITETEKIMKYLRKVEYESQKGYHEASRRISDLENGGLSRRGIGGDGFQMPLDADEVEGKRKDLGLLDSSIFEKETAEAKAKKSKRRKRSTKRKKKQTKRRKKGGEKKTKHYLVGGTKRDREDDRYGGNQCTNYRWAFCPWPTRLCNAPAHMIEECGEF